MPQAPHRRGFEAMGSDKRDRRNALREDLTVLVWELRDYGLRKESEVL